MKRKHVAAILATGIICASVCPAAMTAGANSASPYWDGENGRGVYSADENCPLQVKSENLTFDITGFPDNGEYTSSVRAEYNFYNPTNGDITAHMLFPFGREPDYYSALEDVQLTESVYGVEVNGESVAADLRYTYCAGYNFDFATESALILDYKKQAYCLSDSTAVTKITHSDKNANGESVSGGNTDYGYAKVSFTIDEDKSVILTKNNYFYSRESESGGYVSSYILLDLDYDSTIYVLGEMPEDFSISYCNVTIKETYSSYERIIDELFTPYVSNESAGTLGEFLEQYNAFDDGYYSEIDWFNFCVDLISDDIYRCGTGFSTALNELTFYIPLYGVGSCAMRWFSYDLTVEAGGYTLNAVTAPTYPTIDQSTDPLNYAYYYLLSPAATWNSFENLTITVNAPYYLLNSSAEFTLSGSVENGDSVYTATYESLPSGELYFTLCISENPQSTNNFDWTIAIILLIGLLLVIPAASLIAGIIILVIFLARHRRKTKGNLQ